MTKNVFIPLALVCLLAASVCSCQKDPVETLADQIWEYALKNPEGFNLDINTMTEPAEGVAASYEMSGGILTGFVDVSHTIVKTIVTDIETEYTYPHRLEWKDI